MSEYLNCPNCELNVPTHVYDTQLYQRAVTISGGYESDSTLDLGFDDDRSDDNTSDLEVESEDDMAAPLVVLRQPKVDKSAATGGTSGMTFSEVSRRFTVVMRAAHMSM